jgi:hypothetical protein
MEQSLQEMLRNAREGFMATDTSSAHQLFHDWVMGNHN